MDPRMPIGKIAQIACITFSTAFFVTFSLYWVLNLIFHSEIYYLGLATVALLFTFLLSVAYAMGVLAKRTLDKGVKNQEERLRRSAETNAQEEENEK